MPVEAVVDYLPLLPVAPRPVRARAERSPDVPPPVFAQHALEHRVAGILPQNFERRDLEVRPLLGFPFRRALPAAREDVARLEPTLHRLQC